MKNEAIYRLFFAILITTIVASSCKKAMINPLKKDGSVVAPTVNADLALTTQTNLRVVGYLYQYDVNKWNQYTDSVDLDQLSHIIYSFVNPYTNHTLNLSGDVINAGVVNAVTKCHNKSIETFYAIGGGGATAYWDTLINPANRAQTITQLRKIATAYNFDGIDIDLEGSRITVNYNDFLIQLSDTLVQYSKKLSIALGKWQGNQVSAQAYSRLNYLNAMIYDFQYSTAQSASSFSDFQNHITFFKTKLAASKINAGVPFYASKYEGNTWLGQTIAYNKMLEVNAKAYDLNYSYSTPTQSWWFDGHPVIRQKVAHCLQQSVGGMMVWQALFDTKDDKSSLFKLINYCAANPSGFNPADAYVLSNWGNGKAMVVDGSTDGAAVVQRTVSTAATQWKIGAPGGNSYVFTNAGNNMVLQVTAASLSDGAGISQGIYSGANHQQFKLVSDMKGYYTLTNVNSNKPAQTNGTADNTPLTQNAASGGNNQKWRLSRQ